MRSVDVPAPLERLDDALMLAMRLSGFLSTASYYNVVPSTQHGPWERWTPMRHVQPAAEFCASCHVAREGGEQRRCAVTPTPTPCRPEPLSP